MVPSVWFDFLPLLFRPVCNPVPRLSFQLEELDRWGLQSTFSLQIEKSLALPAQNNFVLSTALYDVTPCLQDIIKLNLQI